MNTKLTPPGFPVKESRDFSADTNLILAVCTYVILKFRSIKQQISIPKCLWKCREYKTTHLGQNLKRKNISFKSYRRTSIRHF